MCYRFGDCFNLKSLNGSLVLLLLFCCWTIQLRAEPYQVEGEIVYATGTNHVPMFTRSFQLTVSDCAWSIRVNVTQGTDPTPVKRFEVVHDGQNIYCYSYLGIPSGSPVANTGVAEIASGHIPFEDASFANYVWLGLASGCVFTKSGQIEVQPPWLIRDAKPTALRVEILLADAPPRLPERIAFHEPPGLKARPFDKGWLAGEMRVLSRTNVGKLSIPNEFIFERFKPKQGASQADELLSRYQVKVSVNSIVMPPVGGIVPPENDGVTLVYDRRLAITGGVNGISYMVTNGNLPKSPDAPALQEFAKLTTIQRASGSHSKPGLLTKRGVVLFFIISVSVGALIVVRHMKTKRT